VTDAPAVNMVGIIMLESADIYPDDIEMVQCSNHITVAKNVIKGEPQIGLILADAYEELSSLVKKQIKPLIRSQIHMLHHAFLISPRFSDKYEPLLDMLVTLHDNEKGLNLLKTDFLWLKSL